ncbi:MAG TPA: cyclodeaminase/cyclohydrolase family protein [Candidatus Angelobacter sp.]|nr:cyclodeaminase/cyclohydrolase family protein [Candidatus Angelobacter sp.]
MPETLTELRVDAFLQRLSSPTPTPGGGSAAALAGAAGAALVHMVLELTAGRPDAPDDETLTELRTAAAVWQSELLHLVELDAAAYDAVIASRRLPRDTDREREHRRVQVVAAVREAIRVPLGIVRRASEVIDLAGRVAPMGNRNAISDIGVAALLAAASARGAALNVRINVPALPEDDPVRSESLAELDRLLRDLDARERSVAATVEARLG